ncbi:MAG TPA: PD-(D/E)XK nuclease family protein [Acidobacteriaceae bacterium]|nr:PD-(D/E)XK nuclease family protein [Acidobacteriaceae bacterium]
MPVSQQVKQAFSAGTMVLTSTVRTARWLRREYALEQRAAGRRAWVTPPIEDWDTWLREQWHAIAVGRADVPLLLTSLQERRVWTRMLKADSEQLVSTAGMAAFAESAYSLLSSYRAHGERKRSWGKSDADSFRRWAADFDAECARKGWMPQAEIQKRVAGLVEEMECPAEMLLVGFGRVPPAQESVLQALGEKGVSIAFAELEEAVQVEYVRAAGQRQEIEACAFWVRERLKENSERRIGVLAPDLGAVRSEVERTFRRVLMPQADNIFSAQPMPFEFSLGLPLADVPVIRAALLLLRWLHEPLTEEEVTWLLLSGFLLQDETDFLTLAKLDAWRRDNGALSLEISLREFFKSVKAPYRAACKRLEDVLRFAEANRLAEGERLPGGWTDIVQLLLREAGWPGGTKRDTLHFQALRRWERTLDEIGLLNFDGHRMMYGDFLKMLAAHAQEAIFAPESEGAPVQIMGAIEASGQQFDAIWFLAADDQRWPQRGRPHPLLPNDVQRSHGMPYADPAVDLELARMVTDRIVASAPKVVFSYAERNKDGEMRPSPLLPRGATWLEADEPLTESEGPELEALDEGSEVAAWPQELVAGGYAVLKEQAACPFQAFAKKRLRAEPLQRNEWGLSEAERGTLLHKALERIWSPDGGALHTLENLQAAVGEGRLDEILRAAIAESFANYDGAADGWERAYLESETRRLQVRLKVWMEKEAERAPFKVIACEEKLDQVSVGELKLRLRVDRVDELAGGGRVLIDYKSSKVGAQDWEAPRPNEPQLPLYAIFGGIEKVRGVLFGQIRADGTVWKGSVSGEEVPVLADEKKNSNLAKTPYDASRRDAWEAELQRLADDFLRGEAMVDPKQGDKTCKYCGLQGLCRVTELRGSLEDAEPKDESGDA